MTFCSIWSRLRGRSAVAIAGRTRAQQHWLVVVVLAGPLVGCGHVLYAMEVNSASSKLAEARELGAEQYAPYEYYMAKEHLNKARTEAAEADYQDAAELSSASEDYAEKAIQLSREAHRGAGR